MSADTGEARRMLHFLADQLDQGCPPDTVLRNASRYADRLPPPDKLLPVLIAAWLTQAHRNGRHLRPLTSDASTLLDMFRWAAGPNQTQHHPRHPSGDQPEGENQP